VLKGSLQKFQHSLFVLWAAVTTTFFLLHLTPGDPVLLVFGDSLNPQDYQLMKERLGLHLPLLKQYTTYIVNLLGGNLGLSFRTELSVTGEIVAKLPATFELALASIFLSITVGIPTGAVMARRVTAASDKIIGFFTLAGISTPSFILAPVLVSVFAVNLDWLPISERHGFASLILPAFSLGLPLACALARMTRASLLENLNDEYIRVARAKGVGEGSILFKHALANSMGPIVTLLSQQIGAVLTGVVLVETIFDWPGLGELVYRAIQSRDYPLVQGSVLVIASTYVLANTLADIAYSWANPRIELK
jgi:peptide/nickel transport system permease protein